MPSIKHKFIVKNIGSQNICDIILHFSQLYLKLSNINKCTREIIMPNSVTFTVSSKGPCTNDSTDQPEFISEIELFSKSEI